MGAQRETEVDRNYQAFISTLPDIISRYEGKYALMHRQEIVGYFDTALAAITEGFSRFGENDYSVQEVTAERDNLGFYSYAGGTGRA